MRFVPSKNLNSLLTADDHMMLEDMSQTETSLVVKSVHQPPAELYLSKDILQGEKVPFYVVWRDTEVKRISLRYFGFKSIVKLYNIRDFEQKDREVIIKKDQLKVDGYVGGVLATTRGG